MEQEQFLEMYSLELVLKLLNKLNLVHLENLVINQHHVKQISKINQKKYLQKISFVNILNQIYFSKFDYEKSEIFFIRISSFSSHLFHLK